MNISKFQTFEFFHLSLCQTHNGLFLLSLWFQIVDDMKFTVSHVVEPVERSIAKINKTFHQISENVKRHDEERRRSTKDDSYLVPMRSWRTEYSDVHDGLVEGSVSDSGMPSGKRQHSKASASRMRR